VSRSPTVAFLVTGYPTPSGSTEGVFHRTLAEALTRAGAQVDVVAPLPRVPWPLPRVAAKWRDYESVPYAYRLGEVSVRRPRYWQLPKRNYLGIGHRSFARCLRESLTRRPDLVHAHFAYPCGLGALEAAAEWSVPVVLTLHGSDVNLLAERSRRSRRQFEKAVQGATLVTAVSEALVDRTERLTGRRPVVMPIGTPLARYTDLPSREIARERLGLPRDRRIALFVGSLLPLKGVSLLLEALASLPRQDVVGVFVGDGPLRPEVEKAPRVIATGPVPNERIPTYLRAADILVLPSFSEGMPTVLVEAGAAGLPVVASDVGGIRELLGDGRGSIVPAGDRPALVRAIDSVLSGEAEAAERANRLREYVARNYDADENARRTLGIYDSLLGGPS